MFDIKLIKGDLTVTYTVMVTAWNHLVNKEVTHTGVIEGDDDHQTAIVLDTGRANDVLKISGIIPRNRTEANYEGTTVVFPGVQELETVFKDWWIGSNPAGAAGMPRIQQNPTLVWIGEYGKCKITETIKEPETAKFEIEFNVQKRA